MNRSYKVNTQGAKCLLCKNGDLSLIPRTHIRGESGCRAMYLCSQSQGGGDKQIPGTRWIAGLVQLLSSSPITDPVPKKTKGVDGT